MKCIGEKCPFYKEHDYRESYYLCELDGIGRRKDMAIKTICDIKEEYNQTKLYFERLRIAVITIILNQEKSE